VGFDLPAPFEPVAFDEVVAASPFEAPNPSEVVAFADPAAFVEPFASAPEAVGVPEPVEFAQPAAFGDHDAFAEPAAFAEPVAFADPLDPAADEAGAPAVQWSPWAQALGLGAPAPEGDLVVDPLAGPGIAEMIAGAHGLSDVEHVLVPPVPMAPEASAVPDPRAPLVETWAAQDAAADLPVMVEPDPDADTVVPAGIPQPGLLADLMPRGE
jgi:hypothetical protein